MPVASGRFEGGCHCGAIGFSYDCSAAPAAWSVRACQCRFCRAHNALTTSDPAASIEFHAADAAQLRRYRFGLETADFLLCKNCGVYIGAAIDTPKGRFGIVNVRGLRPAPANLPDPVPASYDGESEPGRIARREQRWSPVTGMPAGAC